MASFWVFRHCATFFTEYFFWKFFSQMVPIVVPWIFLSLRYGADLGRSRLVFFFSWQSHFEWSTFFRLSKSYLQNHYLQIIGWNDRWTFWKLFAAYFLWAPNGLFLLNCQICWKIFPQLIELINKYVNLYRAQEFQHFLVFFRFFFLLLFF